MIDQMIRKSIHALIIAFVLFLVFQLNELHFTSANDSIGEEGSQQTHVEDLNDKTSNQESDSNQYNITHMEIVKLTDEFMNILVQDIDEEYRVVHFDTKEELVRKFEEVTTQEVAFPYVDYYYNEEAGSLYIVPTETPPWFMEENDYDIVQLDENQIKIIQENQSVLYGNYIIEIVFTHHNDKWKITEILYPA
ncbi:hypothetical protein GMD78_16905 [Ornithinibacillus sp. L9]|uniref:DUF3993 domain-containing protein n=1 Tax=Ornithinibacillus caprae TaxID=2678566 RepID=A0A6N8FKZ2_9BACI|nr:hypothetical protein [Ornithinibacillus caprae]MUK90053.1 hypothetical protein [Ornithinibacillus caprae]